VGNSYRIDLIDRCARKSPLGSVADKSIRCTMDTKHPISVEGELYFSPEDKLIYLKIASTHGDTLKLSISNETRTFLGDFCLNFFDPQSNRAVFHSVGDVKVIC
jgi:hypothetical protein